jgi:hypothetical protein
MEKESAVSQEGPAAELETALERRLGSVLSQVYRKLNIDQVRAESGSIGDLDIAKVVLGTANIERVVLTGLSAELNGAQAFLQNVRMVLELDFDLHWKIDLGWIFEDSGTVDLPSLYFGMNLGNVSVPSLANIDIHAPNFTANNLQVDVAPINNLDLNGARFRKLTAKETDLPADGFGLSGLGVGSASIKNLSVPKTSTAQVNIEEFQPNSSVVIPAAQTSDLQIPAAQADDITTGGFNFLAQASARSLDVDLGILEIRIQVTPKVHLDVGSMAINDLSLNAAASHLRVENIEIPVQVKGVAMRDVVLQTVRIGEIAL